MNFFDQKQKSRRIAQGKKKGEEATAALRKKDLFMEKEGSRSRF